MVMFQDRDQIDTIFRALAEQLKAEGVDSMELVVCGGAALNVLGLVSRRTQDVDIVAIAKKDSTGQIVLEITDRLDDALLRAARKVQKDFDLKEDWLNAKTALVIHFGLPTGLMKRVETRRYQDNLIIHFIGRYDQIHFKLFAAFDSEGRRSAHLGDLLALNPEMEEIEAAARWILTRDASDFYKHALKDFLVQIGQNQIGFKNAAERL